MSPPPQGAGYKRGASLGASVMARDDSDPSGLRVGGVPYLNSRILLWGLGDGGPGYSLALHTPRILAHKLAAGELDAALASSIELLRHPEYRPLAGLGICGRGEMWSIRLFHRVPLQRLRRVALDPHSETTNALAPVVLKERFGLTPEFAEPAAGRDPAKSGRWDGFLKIGDAALAFRDERYQALDLVTAWHELTGRPFIFAFWLARPGLSVRRLEDRLRLAYQEGVSRAPEIAATEGPRLGLTVERAFEYITRIVHYEIGPDEQAGLTCFRKYLVAQRLISS